MILSFCYNDKDNKFRDITETSVSVSQRPYLSSIYNETYAGNDMLFAMIAEKIMFPHGGYLSHMCVHLNFPFLPGASAKNKCRELRRFERAFVCGVSFQRRPIPPGSAELTGQSDYAGRASR